MYLHHTDAKKLWDALEADYGSTDAGAELYIMEQYHDYKMTDGKSVVEQAHEIQCMGKELEHSRSTYPTSLSLVASLLSCLLHGGTSPPLSNIRGWRYQCLI
jgi:hypothetical protein